MSQQINLLNPLLKKHRDYFSFMNMIQALGFVILGSGLFYGYAFYQASLLTKQFEESSQRYVAEQTRLTLFSQDFSVQQDKENLQAEESRLKRELDAQGELAAALKLSAVGSTSGFSEYLRSFARQVVQGLWLTDFKVIGDGAEIRLSGAALNPELLPIYIQRLGKEKIMHGKTFSVLQIQVGTAGESKQTSQPRYVEFTLYSTLDSEAKK